MPSGAGGLLHFVGQRSARDEPSIGHERVPQEGDQLPGEDIQAIYRLLKVIHSDLARRAAPLMRTPDFDRLEWLLEIYTSPGLTIGQSESVHRSFILGLLQNGATNPELETIGALSHRLGRHYQAGMRELELRPATLPAWGELHRVALAEFRRGDPDRAARSMLRLAERTEGITLGITLPRNTFR